LRESRVKSRLITDNKNTFDKVGFLDRWKINKN
jgi:hypothetical protein